MALIILPSLVLFQKLTPLNVEATMMAFAASVVNLSRGLVGKLSAIAINSYFVGVEKDKMENYYMLKIIAIVACFYQIAIVKLIPLKNDI